MPFQTDKFGHKSYRYEPGEGTLIERCPDKLVSASQAWFELPGRSTTYFMEVRGLGVLTMRCTSGHPDGKFKFEGVALVTDEEIQFD